MLKMVGVASLSDFFALLLICRCLFSPAMSATSSVTGDLWTSFDSLSPADVSSASFVPARGECALECRRHAGCQGFFYNDVSKMCVNATSDSDIIPGGLSVSGFRYYTDKYTCPMTTTNNLVDLASSSCFVVSDTPQLHWEDARDHCNITGGQLAVLDTQGKVDFIMTVMVDNPAYPSDEYHLGARRPVDKWNTPWPASGQDFVWLNGQPLDVTVADGHWLPENPNNSDNGENFIQLTGTSRLWRDKPSILAGYICQYSLV